MAFEAARPTAQRPLRTAADYSPDQAWETATPALREWGRWLDENSELANAVLDDHTTMLIGPMGRQIVPDVRLDSGEPDDATNMALTELLEEWSWQCDTSGEIDWPELQRQVTRARAREGEAFLVEHIGGASYPFAPSEIPYRLEMLESDYCPHDGTLVDRGFIHGIQIDTFHRPINYAFYREHPGNLHLSGWMPEGLYLSPEQLAVVPADLVLHVKRVRRWPQIRGVSLFAAAVPRIHAIKDYEDSENQSARINARISLILKRDPDATPPPMTANDSKGQGSTAVGPQSGEAEQPAMEVPHGTVFDGLQDGETIDMLDSTRPNPNMNEYLRGQLQRLCAGTATRYSRVAGDFLSGTWSGQRQEQVEAAMAVAGDARYLDRTLIRRVWRRLVEIGVIIGRVPANGRSLEQLTQADIIPPGIPYIDPAKEVDADVAMIDNGLDTRENRIRFRGRDPRAIPEPVREPQEAPA